MLTLTPPPGTYTSNTTVTITGPSNVAGVIMTTDGSDPVIVKTVAASDAYAPSIYPYIQTIEDGRGRAVFDGSFVKYYNSEWMNQSNPNSFANLGSSFKFLWNAWDFILNGGTKLLILGDATESDNGDPGSASQYWVKGDTRLYDFHLSLTSLAVLKGVQLTVKDRTDYSSGILDPTFPEVSGFDAVMLFSSRFYSDSNTSPRFISVSGANNLAQFRRNGGGLYLCTDNTWAGDGEYGNTGRFPEGFTVSANQVLTAVTNAEFTGLMTFEPGTTVQYNRTNYGDSPLFNGMADSDILVASGSDSFVRQEATDPVPLPITTTVTNGYTSLKFAVLDNSGNVTFEQYGYNVGQPPIVELCTASGTTIEEWPQTNLKSREVHFKYLPGSFGNGAGFVTVNGVTVGSFQDTPAGVIDITWMNTQYTSASTPNVITVTGQQNPDINVELSLPVVFTYSWNFDRFIPQNPVIFGRFVASVNRNEFLAPKPMAAQVLKNGESAMNITAEKEPAHAVRSLYNAMT